MIIDADDFYDANNRLDLIYALKEANPAFKMTLFTVPGLCTDTFLASLPDYLEVAVHGWLHPDPYECVGWTRSDMERLLVRPIVRERCIRLFKAPGWQISDACYDVLLAHDYAVADQPYNDERRPAGLRVHRLGDGDHSHHHVQDVCGNGLKESWDALLSRVTSAESFEFVSEAVRPWTPVAVA